MRAALVDRGEATGLLDDDCALAGPGDAHVHAVGGQPVIAGVAGTDVVVDDAAGALDVTRDHIAGDVAGHVDGVAAQAADDAGRHAWLRRQHVDRVVALERVDLEDLDVGVGDRQARAVDRRTGNDDVVGELGAEDDDLVETVAAVDRDRRVDVVLDLVIAAASADIGLRCGREAVGELGHRDLVGQVEPHDVAGRAGSVGVAGGAPGDAVQGGLCEGERADHEQVVPVVALQAQRGLVGVDGEDVVTRATNRHQGLGVAGAEPAAGSRDGAEHVRGRDAPAVGVARGRRQVVAAVPLEPEDLPDLEGVVACPSVEGGDGTVVIGGEVVVATEPVDLQPPVDGGVVVDPLDLL